MMKMVASMLFLLLSCASDDAAPEGFYVDGYVINGGNPAVDGCGWMIVSEQQNFFPINLSRAMWVDSLPVRFHYRTLGDHVCAWSVTKGGSIELLDIDIP